MKNIQQTKFKNQQRCQKGFTLMEIAIVMLVLAALVGTMASSLWNRQDTVTIQQAVLFFTKSLPQAVVNAKINGYSKCFKKVTTSVIEDGDFDATCDGDEVAVLDDDGVPTGEMEADQDAMAKALIGGGAQSTTEWGESWKAAYCTGVMRIQYYVNALDDAAILNLTKAIEDESTNNGPLIPHVAGADSVTSTAASQGVVAGDVGSDRYITVYLRTR